MKTEIRRVASRAKREVRSLAARVAGPEALAAQQRAARPAATASAKPVSANPAASTPMAEPAVKTKAARDPRWHDFTERTLAELKASDELYRPTSFWGPGLTQLLDDMDEKGLANFKSWPTATFWFYPVYGTGINNATIDSTVAHLRGRLKSVNEGFVRGALTASHEANRDFDVVRLMWDQERWPLDLDAQCESMAGKPRQYFRMYGDDRGWTRPMLNYSLCLAALSQHIDEVPKRFLEIGGGFGSLGELVMSHDPEATYVDVDIPPLLTVATWYLQEVFGDRVEAYDAFPASGPIEPSGSTVLPSYRLPDLRGEYDVFVNSFSFQEMEPHVVENYAKLVSELGVKWVVSLNSRLGKPKKADGHEIGVHDPVTSQRIVDMFGKHGFTLCEAYDRPFIRSAGQLVVLRRD